MRLVSGSELCPPGRGIPGIDAETRRNYAERNGGRSFPARFDRTHRLHVVGQHDLSERWSMGIQFILASGPPVALPHQSYYLQGPLGERNYYEYVLDYGDYYDVRQPLYNRLDLSWTYTFEGWGGKWEWFLNLYNAYAYPNPLFIQYYRGNKNPEKFSSGFVPSVGLNFVF